MAYSCMIPIKSSQFIICLHTHTQTHTSSTALRQEAGRCESRAILYLLTFWPKQHKLQPPAWAGVCQVTLSDQSTPDQCACQITDTPLCEWCLNMQNNELILPWEKVKHLIGILETIAKESKSTEKKRWRTLQGMSLKIGCFELLCSSSPHKRCLLFFESKGSQAADADPGAQIPFPLPSLSALRCPI